MAHYHFLRRHNSEVSLHIKTCLALRQRVHVIVIALIYIFHCKSEPISLPRSCWPRYPSRLNRMECTFSCTRTPRILCFQGWIRRADWPGSVPSPTPLSSHSCCLPRPDLFHHYRSRASRSYNHRVRALSDSFMAHSHVSCFLGFDLQEVLERLDRIGHRARVCNDVVLSAS